jgi:hypothetical protein
MTRDIDTPKIVDAYFFPILTMTYERRTNYFGTTRRDAKHFAHDVYLVGRRWVRLAWHIGCCLVLTSRVLVRVVVWTVRMLMPVPLPVGPTNRQRRAPTGLSIPTFDLIVIVFGTAALVGYLW